MFVRIKRSLRRALSTSPCSRVDRTWSYTCGPGTQPMVGLTMGQLVNRSADKYHDREAIVSCHQGVRKTFAELKGDIDRLAAGFISLGLRRGDRIGIWGPNTYEWFITQFAVGKAGLVLVNRLNYLKCAL